jgi:GH35 family endo-1,4-beta-xylanase
MTAEDEKILAGADARIEEHRKGDMTLKLVDANGTPLPAALTVNIEQTQHEFLFGSTIFQLHRWDSPEQNAAYEKLFTDLLNYATLPFYWWDYERELGKPNYARTEELVSWCKANGITPKGHPLAFNTRDPRWLPEDPNAAMDLQVSSVSDRVSRFKDAIGIWDVVNEAAAWDRQLCWDNAPRLTAAINKIGVPTYVRGCFEAARKANPQATLIINDYITDEKYEKVISDLVDADGKPMYDIIGIQSHQHGGAWSMATTWQICQRFAKFNKPLHFTEVTFVSGKLAWPPEMEHKQWPSTPEGEKRQAEYTKRFYTVVFSHPAVEAITWWAFNDTRRHSSGGLIKNDTTAKPAYDELKSLIKGKWWTKTDVKLQNGGQAAFRGFFGRYKVNANMGNRRLEGVFKLGKKDQRTATVRMQ